MNQATVMIPFTIMNTPNPTIVTIKNQSIPNLNLEYVFKSTSQQNVAYYTSSIGKLTSVCLLVYSLNNDLLIYVLLESYLPISIDFLGYY